MKKNSIFFLILILTFNIPLIYSATEEGYGEGNENLGQFTDTFENTNNITVMEGVIINATLKCVEMNVTKEGVLDGWSHAKNHSIIGTADGQQTDYQIGIKVYYGSGVDGTEVVTGITFGKVYLDSLCKTGFGDIRFTSGDGLTLLYYWIESQVNSSYAIIWVRLPIIPVNPNTINILIHYGNNEVTTTSDGKNTFPKLFDHFLGNSLNLTVWTVYASDGSVIIAGSIIRVQGNSGANKYAFSSDAPFRDVDPSAIRFRSLIEATSGLYQITLMGWGLWGVQGTCQFKSYQGAHQALTKDSLGNQEIDVINVSNFDSYKVYEITRDGTIGMYYVDGTLVATGDFDPDTSTIGAHVYVRDTEYDLYSDWVLIREWTSNEPTHDSWTEITISESYFITTNYLNYTSGNSLTLLTNTSIPDGSTITIQFSNDNSTWILNDWEPIFGGFEAVDLRILNYTDIYLMYNFSGTPLIIPRLYQSRLVTTNGTGGVGGIVYISRYPASTFIMIIFLFSIGGLIIWMVKKK